MNTLNIWECIICGWLYDESLGCPEDGIAPGTRWEDVPEDWTCPVCGVSKQDFEMVKTGPSQTPIPAAPASAALITPYADQSSTMIKEAPEEAPTFRNSGEPFQIWECIICGWVYDESKGWPDDDILPGTRWVDIPDDWTCPDCGVGKQDFEMIAVSASDGTQSTVKTSEPLGPIDQDQLPVIVVGTGLAGYNFAKEYRKLNTTTPLIMITSDDGRMYYKPAISTAYHTNKSPDQLATATAEEMALELRAEIQTFTSIKSIDEHNQLLETSNGNLNYEKLVLATGARCIELPMAGDGLESVYSINNLMDYSAFRQAMEGKKHVLIIGGGLIGSEYANDLIQSGYEVTVVDPLPSVLSTLMPKAASDSVKNALANAGVQFHFETVVEKIENQATGVKATLASGKEVEADIVLSAVGVRPDLTLAKTAGLQTNRGIITDRSLKTSASNIYALGDCAEVDTHLLFYVAPLVEGAKKLASTINGEEQQVYYGTMPVIIKTTLFPVTVSPPPKTDGQWHIDIESSTGVKALFKTPEGELVGYALTGACTKFRDELNMSLRPIM
jgi:rubredoxin-NAD+ reductase